MKITARMIDDFIQGDIDTAIDLLRDLANGSYTVDTLKADVEQFDSTQGELEDIRRYENFHRG